MAMLRTCEHPGCTTRTLGERCIDHGRLPDPRLLAATRRAATGTGAALHAGTARASRAAT